MEPRISSARNYRREIPLAGNGINYGPYGGVKEDLGPPRFIIVPGPSGTEYYFTPREIRELLISIAVMTFAFAMALGRFDDFMDYLIPSFFAVFTAFFLHEMAHKFAGQSFGIWCEFRTHLEGLALAVLTSIIGIVVASPGVLDIEGNYTLEEAGKMAFVGPGTNLVIALIAIPFYFIGGLIGFTAFLVIVVNSILVLFNLIPIEPLDGTFIWMWSPLHYLLLAGIAAPLFILFYIL